MIKKFLLLITIFASGSVFAQENSVESIRKLFDEFLYNRVIESSNSLLAVEGLDLKSKVEIYLLRARSFYSLNDDEMTRKSFREILKINKSFEPDRSVISTKLISIFNEVKSDFEKADTTQAINPEDISKIIKQAEENRSELKSAFIKNIGLPGWGQIQLGSPTKGWILSGLSTASLASMIYFIFDTNKKEDLYLMETDKFLMSQKYSSYNNSYKLRNISIAAYVALWIYSQIDLLFTDYFPNTPQSISFSTNQDNLRLSFGIPLN